MKFASHSPVMLSLFRLVRSQIIIRLLFLGQCYQLASSPFLTGVCGPVSDGRDLPYRALNLISACTRIMNNEYAL